MEFRIADTFTDSLAKLNGDEQKSVKTTAFDLQLDSASPGMQFHKLDKSRDKNFWSVRVSSDIRLIVHRTADSLLLCYVDHHDKAYDWAERRKLETHPKTGAAQLVEIRETVQEITVPKYVEVEQPIPPKPALFANISDEELLSYGVPEEWLEDAKAATEDTIFEITDHLPHEAAEALLDLAVGVTPAMSPSATASDDPFSHPDALRRFRVMTNVAELQRALDYPWEKWTVFLHPSQRELVEREFSGPARISGSAGTGKTIVALHRAVHLARKYDRSRILLATFSTTLARSLQTKLNRLIGNEPEVANRIGVHSMSEVGLMLFEEFFGKPELVIEESLQRFLREASARVDDHKFSERFLWTEWTEVVDAWNLRSWEAYRDVQRLGRKTRVGEKQRQILWAIFENVREQLQANSLLTLPSIFHRLADSIGENTNNLFEFAVIDEAQDLSVAELRFLGAAGVMRPDALFFTGDLGQRIFQTPFSWKSLGVDIRGRSHTLRINYRTSHQIRSQADRLLPKEIADVDGNAESRTSTISIFNGPPPAIEAFRDEESENAGVSAWIRARLNEGIQPHEIGIFVRSEAQVSRALAATQAADVATITLDESTETKVGCLSISTMHLAKGLEFRAVVVMACDDEVIPLQERIETVTDDSDLEEVYNTERHLLYVACTRARDHLLVTGVEPASEFLEDLIL